MARSTVILVGLALVSSGCVLKSKYEALEQQLDATTRAMQKRIAERDAKISGLESDLSSEKARAAALDAEQERIKAAHARTLAQLEAERAGLEAETARLQGELARVVKDRSRLKGSVEDMQRALAELERRKRAADQRIAEFRQLLERFKALIDAGRLRVKIVDGRMVVELATDVLFGSGSARLSPEGKEAIVEVASVLATMDGRKFQVEGHTDNVPIKTEKYPSNWELAAARAITVTKTMIDAGVPASQVSAASFGETRPTAENESKEGRAANRRIEIALMPDLSSLPGFDELRKIGDTSPR